MEELKMPLNKIIEEEHEDTSYDGNSVLKINKTKSTNNSVKEELSYPNFSISRPTSLSVSNPWRLKYKEKEVTNSVKDSVIRSGECMIDNMKKFYRFSDSSHLLDSGSKINEIPDLESMNKIQKSSHDEKAVVSLFIYK